MSKVLTVTWPSFAQGLDCFPFFPFRFSKSDSFLYASLFLALSTGRKKEVRERNREVLQLFGKAFELVSEEERATATRGNTPHELSCGHVHKRFSLTGKRTRKCVFHLVWKSLFWLCSLMPWVISLSAKPVGLREFPLTYRAATVFQACLGRKCVVTCTAVPRSTPVAVVVEHPMEWSS